MAVEIRRGDVFEGVPDAQKLRDAVATILDDTVPGNVRHKHMAYLIGASKVLSSIPKRAKVAGYIDSRIQQARRG